MADVQGNPFVDQLLRDLRLDQLPEPKRTEVLTKIGKLAERRVLQTVIANMDEGSLNEFEQKLQTGMTEEQAAQFMAEKVPGLAAKVEQALADLHQRLVTDINQIDQALATIPAQYSPPEQPAPPPNQTTPPESQS